MIMIQISEGAARKIRTLMAKQGIDEGDLGLLFVGPDEMRTLKREHLGQDEATDVLSFPIDGREDLPDGVPRQLGDAVLCPQVVGDEPVLHPRRGDLDDGRRRGATAAADRARAAPRPTRGVCRASVLRLGSSQAIARHDDHALASELPRHGAGLGHARGAASPLQLPVLVDGDAARVVLLLRRQPPARR